jgi:predicted RNase H-like HicB family nuclease
MRLQHTINTVVRPGDESGFIAECVEIPVVTQGATLDDTIANLREAVQLHLEGENLADMGLAPDPTLLITMELEPLNA